MPSVKRLYSKEEFAKRGDALYESAVKPNLKPEDDGKIVALILKPENTNWMRMN
jgi:hypothetical protein